MRRPKVFIIALKYQTAVRVHTEREGARDLKLNICHVTYYYINTNFVKILEPSKYTKSPNLGSYFRVLGGLYNSQHFFTLFFLYTIVSYMI